MLFTFFDIDEAKDQNGFNLFVQFNIFELAYFEQKELNSVVFDFANGLIVVQLAITGQRLSFLKKLLKIGEMYGQAHFN